MNVSEERIRTADQKLPTLKARGSCDQIHSQFETDALLALLVAVILVEDVVRSSDLLNTPARERQGAVVVQQGSAGIVTCGGGSSSSGGGGGCCGASIGVSTGQRRWSSRVGECGAAT